MWTGPQVAIANLSGPVYAHYIEILLVLFIYLLTLVAEDFTLEIILCMSINES